MGQETQVKKTRYIILLWVIAAGTALAAVKVHYDRRPEVFYKIQPTIDRATLKGQTPWQWRDWQYRPLVPKTIRTVDRWAKGLGWRTIEADLYYWALVALMAGVILAAAGYAETWGIGRGARLALAASLWPVATWANAGSYVCLDTWLDALLVLWAVTAIRRDRTWLALALVPLAAITKQTGGIIALILFFRGWRWGVAGLTLWAASYGAAVAHYSTWEQFLANHEIDRWAGLAASWDWLTLHYGWLTYGPLVILAGLGWAKAPADLRRLAWLVVPLWMVTHLGTLMWEMRLFLVPWVLIGIPMMGGFIREQE